MNLSFDKTLLRLYPLRVSTANRTTIILNSFIIAIMNELYVSLTCACVRVSDVIFFVLLHSFRTRQHPHQNIVMQTRMDLIWKTNMLVYQNPNKMFSFVPGGQSINNALD